MLADGVDVEDRTVLLLGPSRAHRADDAVALAQAVTLDGADRHVAVVGARQVALDADQAETVVGQVEQTGDGDRIAVEGLLLGVTGHVALGATAAHRRRSDHGRGDGGCRACCLSRPGCCGPGCRDRRLVAAALVAAALVRSPPQFPPRFWLRPWLRPPPPPCLDRRRCGRRCRYDRHRRCRGAYRQNRWPAPPARRGRRASECRSPKPGPPDHWRSRRPTPPLARRSPRRCLGVGLVGRFGRSLGGRGPASASAVSAVFFVRAGALRLLRRRARCSLMPLPLRSTRCRTGDDAGHLQDLVD